MEPIPVSLRTWRRCICMLLIAMRYEVELRHIEKRLIFDDDVFVECIIKIFEIHPELDRELTHNERILMNTNIGGWPLEFHTQYSWHVEAVGCMLWALGEFNDFPDLDQTYLLKDIDQYFGKAGHQGIKSWANSLLDKDVTLRNGMEIQFELKRAEILYQRCAISSMVRDGKRNVTTKKYSELFPLEEYKIPVGPSGDIVMSSGKEFCDLSLDEEGSIAPLALIRIQTFRWIMNQDENWDDMELFHLQRLPE